jgi:predicted site-specific integrase-resolvase
MSQLFYGREDAARRAGVSKETIYRAIRSGALRAKRTGWDDAKKVPVGKYLNSDDDLRAWFDGLADA